jgi:hypothetical protein
LIDRVGDNDGPPVGTRERVRASLGAALGAGALASSTTALGAAASGKTAAATSLLGFAGKTGTTIVLWVLVGGAAGVAVTAPLSFLASRAPSPAVSRQATAPAERAPPGASAPGVTAASPVTLGLAGESARGITAAQPSAPAVDATRSQLAKGVAQQDSVAPPREEASSLGDMATVIVGKSAPSSAMATELMLLKSAQRELNAGNAEASLALLDEHARRYPGGALQVERLGARVFALCRLGRVEPARVAARDFFATAADSPLVPRVVASCAGSGHKGAR